MKPSNEEKKEWWSIINNNPSYCFFNTPYWYDIHSEYYKVRYLIKKTKFKGETVLLPVFRKKLKGLIPIYSNSAFGTYGSIITNFPIHNIDAESNILNKLLTNKNYDYVSSPFLISDNSADNSFTQVIDLQTFELNQISINHNKSVKKAKNNNLEIIDSNVISEWEEYYSIYIEETKLRGEKASNNYAWGLFILIYHLPDRLRKLWLIKEKGKIIGGAIIFHFNIASYWHGVNNKRCKQIGGSHLLQCHAIEDSRRRGFQIYDLCPSGGHNGVVRFKSGFNGKTLYFRNFEYRNECFQRLFKLYNLIN